MLKLLRKQSQERVIAAAAEKLTECQETVFLLGKQLNAMCSPSVSLGCSPNNRQQSSDGNLDDKPSTSSFTNARCILSPQHLDQVEVKNVATSIARRTGGESPSNGYNSHRSPSDTESDPFPKSPLNSKLQKQRSSSSFSSSTILPEKHGRGFSRSFS